MLEYIIPSTNTIIIMLIYSRKKETIIIIEFQKDKSEKKNCIMLKFLVHYRDFLLVYSMYEPLYFYIYFHIHFHVLIVDINVQ